MFESAHFAEARYKFQVFRREAEAALEAKGSFKHLPENDKKEALKDECAMRLAVLREKDPGRYVAIFNLVGFLETVGMMVERNYIPFDDIYDLYAGAILLTDDVLGQHIVKRSEEPGMPAGFYGFFRSLVLKTKERAMRVK